MKRIIIFAVIITTGLSLLVIARPTLAFNSPCALCWQFVSLGYYDNSQPVTIPHTPGTLTRATFVDIDGDGLQDLFMGYSYTNAYDLNDHHDAIVFYLNIGDPKVPKWQRMAEPYAYAGIDTGQGSYPTPTFVDIDGDGDQDLFIGTYDGKIIFYRNKDADDGIMGTPTWASPVFLYDKDNAIIDVGYYAAPAFADIDKDGKQDLFIGGVSASVGTLSFYHNIGTANTASWATPISYSGNVWLNNSGPLPTFVDIDGDGDHDLFIGSRRAGDL